MGGLDPLCVMEEARSHSESDWRLSYHMWMASIGGWGGSDKEKINAYTKGLKNRSLLGILVKRDMKPEVIKPRALKKGGGIGVFTPSWPAHVILREKYQMALANVRSLGFQVVEGSLTRKMRAEGYRSASGKERADELMELIQSPEIDCLMAVIGGSNSSSMIPYLDFEEIRKQRKIVCGYSDVTSLQMAILAYSGLSSLYGPSLVPVFGETPMPDYSVESFLQAAMGLGRYPLAIAPPKECSTHFIDASKLGWQREERVWRQNGGWQGVNQGEVTAPAIIANLETLVTSAGTAHFPDVRGKVLFLEEEQSVFSREERNLRHLELLGIFDAIAGLVISKPFSEDREGAPFAYRDLLNEIVGSRPYPIVTDFDAGHAFPMITLAQEQSVTVTVVGENVGLRVNEAAVQQGT